jgi:hypothetical protein
MISLFTFSVDLNTKSFRFNFNKNGNEFAFSETGVFRLSASRMSEDRPDCLHYLHFSTASSRRAAQNGFCTYEIRSGEARFGFISTCSHNRCGYAVCARLCRRCSGCLGAKRIEFCSRTSLTVPPVLSLCRFGSSRYLSRESARNIARSSAEIQRQHSSVHCRVCLAGGPETE